MLYQIHHQLIKTGQTNFCVQHELPNGDYVTRRDALKKAVDEAWEKWPPPEGHQFMVCTEESPYFLMTTAENNQEIQRIKDR